MLIFVTGGVRSGKSTFAENLAKERVTNGNLHYIATSKQSDEEMMERIIDHQSRRHNDNVHWVTLEPFSEQPAMKMEQMSIQLKKNAVILLDCLTTWLNNEFFEVTEDMAYRFLNASEREKLYHSIVSVLDSLQYGRTLLVVSNELFYDVPAYDEATVAYVAMLGKLHQKIVHMADEAYVCENGIPLQMKGATKIR